MQPKEIEYLLQKYSDRLLSAEEKDRLNHLLQQADAESQITGLLQSMMLEHNSGEPFDEARFMPMLQQMLRADRPAEPATVLPFSKKYHWWKYAAAAAVAVIISGFFYFYASRNGAYAPPPVAGVSADHQPGGNRAILRLADGNEIVLNNTKGNILHDQQLVVSNQSGKLDYSGNTENISYHTLHTPKGGQYTLQLSDGSSVRLNAASSIKFPTSFNGNLRQVEISGEAYFEIAENKLKPFVVNIANRGTVEVLGTRFNVNAYPDEPYISTTLLQGKVKVSTGKGSPTPEQAATLHPGEQVQIRGAALTVLKDIDVAAATAWLSGYFEFSNDNLQTVLRTLSRWYDVEVSWQGNPPNDQFEGKIPMDATLEEVLKLLEKNDVHFRMEGKILIVSTKQ